MSSCYTWLEDPVEMSFRILSYNCFSRQKNQNEPFK